MTRSCTVPLLVFLIIGICSGQRPPESDEDRFAAKMLSFDKDHDRQLTRAEITDARLLRLFDRADTNHDGVVTETELRAQYLRELVDAPASRGGPQIGQIIPPHLRDDLELTADQKTRLTTLQHEVDTRLNGILTEKQRNLLNSGRPRPGPNGFRGGPGFPAPNKP